MIKDSGERSETWLPVVGYEGLYEVSNTGRVKSLRNSTRIKDRENGIMQQKFDTKGYLRVNLTKDKKSKALLVSRLVANAFIPKVDGFDEVGHNDDNKENNTVENLYWTNRSENLTHNGLHLRIRDLRQKKIGNVIKALSVPVIATNTATGETLRFSSMQEAQRNGFDCGKISLCCAGKRNSHKGYMWRKEND